MQANTWVIKCDFLALQTVIHHHIALPIQADQELMAVPVRMFTRELRQGRLVQPFAQELHRGAYWLTRLQSRPVTGAMAA